MSGQILTLVGLQEQGPPSSPRAAARLIGALLRHLRAERGLKLEDVATTSRRLGLDLGSAPTLSRYERASGELKDERIFALLQFYEAPQDVIAEAEALLRQSQGQTWWSSYSDLVSEPLTSVFALESTSKVVRVYQENNIPGMLQTSAYARALMRDYYRAQHDPETRRRNVDLVERRLQMRQQRQLLLDQDDAPVYEAVIAESVLTKELGGARVMREQLRHLYNLAENKPRVHIRILPGSAMRESSPLHPAMTLFKPHDSFLGRTVYLENKNRGGEILVAASDVETYQASMDDWWMRKLSKTETLTRLQMYIERLAAEPED